MTQAAPTQKNAAKANGTCSLFRSRADAVAASFCVAKPAISASAGAGAPGVTGGLCTCPAERTRTAVELTTPEAEAVGGGRNERAAVGSVMRRLYSASGVVSCGLPLAHGVFALLIAACVDRHGEAATDPRSSSRSRNSSCRGACSFATTGRLNRTSHRSQAVRRSGRRP